MRFIRTLSRGLRTQPRYTLMRMVARFPFVRRAVVGGHALAHRRRLEAWLRDCEARMATTMFPQVDRHAFVRDMRRDGVAFGLTLPPDIVDEIRAWAEAHPSFADRVPERGVHPGQLAIAQERLGKPILLTQYFNALTGCPAIARLKQDPALQWIAAAYLRSDPTFVGANLWWTYPVDALPEDRHQHAHLFHRDVDDFAFFKFFFYLTDVAPGDGAHMLVRGSQLRPPARSFADRWNLRRYSDAEVSATYDAKDILEITGAAGTGFAEDTLCIHKARTPETSARLLLQLQYALFDYGNMHDERDPAQLAYIG
ncbi:MAG TPA: hypothetical protein VIE63_10020 [Ramlibacter sp.]|jgi:hypothetical protein